MSNLNDKPYVVMTADNNQYRSGSVKTKDGLVNILITNPTADKIRFELIKDNTNIIDSSDSLLPVDLRSYMEEVTAFSQYKVNFYTKSNKSQEVEIEGITDKFSTNMSDSYSFSVVKSL